jgi:hypothetical protein
MNVLDVTGSVPDVVGMVLGVSEAMSASAGFNCSSCTFTLARPRPGGSGGPSSSAAGGEGPRNGQPASAATSRPSATSAQPVAFGPGPPFFSVRQPRTVTASLFGDPRASAPETIQLGLRTIASDDTFVCTVELRHLEGWDTHIGDQMALELVPTTIPNGVVLSIFGFADPVGSAFGRFYGSLFVEPQPALVTTSPIGEMTVTANTNLFRAQRTNAGFEMKLFDNRNTLNLWDRGQRTP